jgi:LacI family transcriptional regulator
MNVTMRDIAEDLGVSICTVSKVLRDHPDIGSKTKERVLTRVRELNYRPNLTARALVTGRSHTIGLVVPDLVHPFFGEVASGISKILRKHGYSLIISSSGEDGELENRAIDQLLARQVDALVLAACQYDPGLSDRIKDYNTPLVWIDRRPEDAAVNFIGVDDEQIGCIATQHLLDVGCRRIAHIGGPAISTAAGRLEGYRKTLVRHGFSVDPSLVISLVQGDPGGDITGYNAMKQLLALKQIPDSVFCYNDPTAMGAMQAIIEKGLRIPQDLAIIGSGNVRYSNFLRVPLSTVDQQSDEIGIRAAQLGLKLIEAKKPPKPSTILLKPRLIVRESTQRITSNGRKSTIGG